MGIDSTSFSRLKPTTSSRLPWGSGETGILRFTSKALSVVYTMARYFQRYYGEEDARYGYYLTTARAAFGRQVTTAKLQENSGN